jgi:uncharacterized membrane protein YfhO
LCNNPTAGTLVVKENNWTGWRATLDTQPVSLKHDDWLSISLPAGEHQISFRYRPWDVPLGIGLSLLGIILSIVLWVKKESRSPIEDAPGLEILSKELE